MSETQECLNCGAPASPSVGTVPLCSSCQAQSKGNARGVSFQSPKKDPPKAHANLA